MRESVHNPRHGSKGGEGLQVPPCDQGDHGAHARAIQRLFERRFNRSAIERTIRMIGEDPSLFARLYGSVGVVAPIVEELLFRILPAHLLFSEGMQWSIGIPVNFAFVASHNIVPVGEEAKRSIQLNDRVKLSLDVVPLPQFMLGAYCWYVMKRYGDWAPLVAHAVNNQGMALSVVWGGRGTYREYQELLAEELQGKG